MAREGIRKKAGSLDILTPAQIEQVHLATMRVLAGKGVRFCDKRALTLLAENGCAVDFETQTAKFPESLVMDCVAKCPSSFTVRARNPENDLAFETGKVTYVGSSPNMKLLDEKTWTSRIPTRAEFYDYLLVCDALENIDWHTCFPFSGFENVPGCMVNLESLAAKLRCVQKVHQEGTIADNYVWNIAMAEAMGVESMQLLNPTSPSTYFSDNVDHAYYYTEHNTEFCICSGPMMGVSSPATVAGGVIVNNVDALAGIVLTQLLRPGARLNTVSMIMSLNMRTGEPLFGDVGNFMADAVFNQMWRYYNIPSCGTASAWTCSKMIDYQSGYEMTTALLTEILSGASALTFAGGLTAELVGSTLKAVIDNDVIGVVKRLVSGIDTSEEAMAVDLINEVGHMPGNFLAEEHTLDWWKKDQYMPAVADRLSLDKWINGGKKTIIEHGRERMEEILSKHTIPQQYDAKELELEYILNDARNYYRKKGMITEAEWALYMKDISSPNYPYG